MALAAAAGAGLPVLGRPLVFGGVFVTGAAGGVFVGVVLEGVVLRGGGLRRGGHLAVARGGW